jgi:hypothetical protein
VGLAVGCRVGTGSFVSIQDCVGTLVGLLIGDDTGSGVGIPGDPLSGELVGLFPFTSEGLRDGEVAGAFDRVSTGAFVSTPSIVTGIGSLVALVLGDGAGFAVGLPAGSLVGLFSLTDDVLLVGDKVGPMDPLSAGAGVP